MIKSAFFPSGKGFWNEKSCMPAECLEHGQKLPHQPQGLLLVLEQLDVDGPAWRRRVAIPMLAGLQAGPGGQGSVHEPPTGLSCSLAGKLWAAEGH